MKQIILDDIPSRYWIHRDGRLQNKDSGTYLKGTLRNGYRWFDLRANQKKYSRSQHRLLAEAFIENPEDLPIVHHKDGNRLNNQLDNLEWVTYSINNLKKNKRESGIDHSCQKDWDLTNERWKTFRDTRYMISDFGRVKNAESGRVLKGKVTTSGYREYCLTFNNKKNSILAHRLVGEVWLEAGGSEVIDHINGDGLDNRISNLQPLTAQENVIKSYQVDGNRKNIRTVGRYDDEWNILETYLSCAEAARAMGVRPQSINAAIHKNFRSCGFLWKYVD